VSPTAAFCGRGRIAGAAGACLKEVEIEAGAGADDEVIDEADLEDRSGGRAEHLQRG
jgi:hypothetical protein